VGGQGAREIGRQRHLGMDMGSMMRGGGKEEAPPAAEAAKKDDKPPSAVDEALDAAKRLRGLFGR